MKHTVLPRIAALTLALVATASGWSQKRIAQLADKLERLTECESYYTEQRNPKTKKLVKQTRTFQFTNKGLVTALIRAFEDERENTVKATKSRNTYYWTFPHHSTYTLNYEKHGKATLYIVKRTAVASEGDKDETMIRINGGSELQPDVFYADGKGIYWTDEDGNKYYSSGTVVSKDRLKKLRQERAKRKKRRGRSVSTSTTTVTESDGTGTRTVIYSYN